MEGSSRHKSHERSQPAMSLSFFNSEDDMRQRKPYKGLIRSLQQMGCTHMLELYCQGLTSRKGQFEQDLEFSELQVRILQFFFFFLYWRLGSYMILCFTHIWDNVIYNVSFHCFWVYEPSYWIFFNCYFWCLFNVIFYASNEFLDNLFPV